MKTLNEVKDEVARSYGFTWEEILNIDLIVDQMVTKVAKRYAEEAIKECAERAKAYNQVPRAYSDAAVDKESIMDVIQELK